MKNFTKNLIKVSIITSFIFAILFLLSPALTFAADLACGDTITSSTTLTTNLTCSGTGLIIGADSIILDCAGHSITGNNSGVGDENGSGIDNRDGYDNVTVKNCNVSQFKGAPAGIYFVNSDHSSIVNNTVNGNDYGVLFDNGTYNIVASNTVESNYRAGIDFTNGSNNVITNNTVSNNDIIGIELNASSNNTVELNNTHSNDTGIYLTSSTFNMVKDNNSSSNRIYGIVLESSSVSNNIINNNFSSNGFIGISIVDESDLNTFSNNVSNSNTNSGLEINGSSNNIISNNTFNDNLALGININSNSNDNSINSNTLSLNGDYGIYIENTTSINNIITSNLSSSNGLFDVFLQDASATSTTVITGNTGTINTVIDADGDGILDNIDQCPTISGTVSGTGCPFAIKATVDIKITDQQKSGVCGYDNKGKPKSECKNLLADSEVKLFDRENLDFKSLYGQRMDKKQFDLIFDGGIGQVGSCTTDTSGVCTVGVDHSGKFLMIAKLMDGTTLVYTGKSVYFKNKGSDEDDDEDKDGQSIKSPLINKNLHFIKIIRKDGTVSYKPGKNYDFLDSKLHILSPEYDIFEGSAGLYPFVIISDINQTVDICFSAKGYNVKGAQDGNGNTLGSSDCAKGLVLVSGQAFTVIFNIIETKSDSDKSGLELSIASTVNGKKIKNSLTIDGVSKKNKDSQEKDLKTKIKQTGDKMKQEKDKERAKRITAIKNQLALAKNGSVWGKVGIFFARLGTNIAVAATVLTSFLFR